MALARLRELLKREGLSAYIIPTEDAHGSEYIANCDKRRAFISGFTGSAGTAVVTLDKAALWTDGRYFLQLHAGWTLMKSGMPGVPSMNAWIIENTTASSAIGIHAHVVSKQEADSYTKSFKHAGRAFKPTNNNLVDEVWTDRPAASAAPIFAHDIKCAFICSVLTELRYAGVAHAEKIEDVRDVLEQKEHFGWLFSGLDEIAYIPFNPVFMAFALVTLEEVILFVDPAKVLEPVQKHLGTAVKIQPYASVFAHLMGVTKPVCIDPRNANLQIAHSLGKNAVEDTSPITLWKAVKNEVEIEGMRQAHLRDGAALISFLAWLEAELQKNPAPALTECSASDKLEDFRAAQRDYVSLSFETIAGSGSNGAIIHYKPELGTCAAVNNKLLFLLDSGGQYRDGTTDVTRTQHYGEPTAEEKRCFTRVLQGHIALDRAVFPQGTVGAKLDILARLPLWMDGLNYRHGTGHGVGAFLNVHEGPHGIGARESALLNPLQPGMTVTNGVIIFQPGYYKDGHFGIRIENVMVVRTAPTPNQFGGPYYCFEHITFSPIQTKMIDLSIATEDEIKWVNSYNMECLHKVGPLLQENARKWLERETQPIKR